MAVEHGLTMVKVQVPRLYCAITVVFLQHMYTLPHTPTGMVKLQGFTGHFMWVYGKMVTTIEIYPSSVTEIFWTQVSLCCKKADDFWII